MKYINKVSLICLMILSGTFAYPQDTLPQYKPVKSTMGFGLTINGLINNINLNAPVDQNNTPVLDFSWYFSNQNAFNLSLGMDIAKERFSSVDSLGNALVSWDSSAVQSTISIAPSVAHHIEVNERLDPFIGAGLYIAFTSKQKMNSNRSSEDTLGTGTRTISGTAAGGYDFGIKLNTGFEYFIAHYLSVGAEYGIVFSHPSYGGDWSTVIIDTPAATQKPKTTRMEGSSILSSTTLNVEDNVLIILRYYFNKGK